MESSTPKRSPSAGPDSTVKRARMDDQVPVVAAAASESTVRPYQKGTAPIKSEYLVRDPNAAQLAPIDDDAAEGAKHAESQSASQSGRSFGGNDRKKRQRGGGKDRGDRGQTSGRRFGTSRDKVQLCPSRVKSNEKSPVECKFGDKCRFEHDLRAYLEHGRRGQMDTFGGKCPAFEARGLCHVGWKCRFVDSHSEERKLEDGSSELILLGIRPATTAEADDGHANRDDDDLGLINVIPTNTRIDLSRRRIETEKANKYIEWLATQYPSGDGSQRRPAPSNKQAETEAAAGEPVEPGDTRDSAQVQDERAAFQEPPFRASEKRRLYYGPETPILAPLTTQGNLPFRRLCVELGAQVTFSEMAVGMPLVQGEKSEWALLRAHPSELAAPTFSAAGRVVAGYDHSRDLRFGAQIAANKPWIALKTTEVLSRYCPALRTIDLNCGCPIELIYQQGAGSALLEQPSKLEKMLRGMNDISGEIPISVKIRMGTKDDNPTAQRLVNRLVLGSREAVDSGLGPCGVAAITLHGRSRQQRYSRRADWEYIAETGALIKRLEAEQSQLVDTIRQADDRDLANTPSSGATGSRSTVYFVGNGDCYSHTDYTNHLTKANVDAVMVGRGALVKPWLFEEIEAGQYLDKSSSERLEYIKKFCQFGLETWGADEMGIGVTRRFLLEWLSFSCRYVPVGLLDHLPPHLNDRPAPYRGRDDLETLMASPNFKDWIKLSEMFLGPAPDDFRFEPKHKSNSFEPEG